MKSKIFHVLFVLLYSTFVLFNFFSVINLMRFKYNPITPIYSGLKEIEIVIFSSRVMNYDRIMLYYISVMLLVVYLIYNYFVHKSFKLKLIHFSNGLFIILLMFIDVFIFNYPIKINIFLYANLMLLIGLTIKIIYMEYRVNIIKSIILNLIIYLIFIEVPSFYSYLRFIFDATLIKDMHFNYYINLETQVSNSFSFLIPYMLSLAFALYCLVVFMNLINSKNMPAINDNLKKFKHLLTDPNQSKFNKFTKPILLTVFLLGFFLMLYPYLLNNFEVKEIGWGDMPVYVRQLERITPYSASEIIQYSLFENNDRSLSIIFLWALKKLTNLPAAIIVKSIPFIVYPLLFGFTCFSVEKLYGNRDYLLFAVFSVASGYQILQGLAYGYLANMLALVPFYFFLGCYTKISTSKIYSLISALTLIVIKYTHSYLWLLLLAVVFSDSILSLIQCFKSASTRIKLKELNSRALILVTNVIPFILSFLIKLENNGATQAFNAFKRSVAFVNVIKYFKIFNGVVLFGYEPINNVVFICLLLISSAFFLVLRKPSLTILVHLGVISFLLTVVGNFTITLRTMYNFPIQFYVLYSLNYGKYLKNDDELLSKLTFYAFIIFLVLFNLNYALRFGYRISQNM